MNEIVNYTGLLKDCDDFHRTVNDALEYHKRFGVVSIEKQKEVDDKFTDLYAKLGGHLNKRCDIDTAILSCKFMGKMFEYNKITGNSFSLLPGLFKTIWEIGKDG